MNYADLSGARLYSTVLNEETGLKQTLLRHVRVKAVDFTEVKILATQLHDMFGNATVTLAPHHTRPDHWPDMVLRLEAFDTEYEKWVEDPEGYKFDRTLYEPKTP